MRTVFRRGLLLGLTAVMALQLSLTPGQLDALRVWMREGQITAEMLSRPLPSVGAVQAAYIGNANTHKFHRPDCASVKQMNESNRVPLADREAAAAGGYIPCKRCDP